MSFWYSTRFTWKMVQFFRGKPCNHCKNLFPSNIFQDVTCSFKRFSRTILRTKKNKKLCTQKFDSNNILVWKFSIFKENEPVKFFINLYYRLKINQVFYNLIPNVYSRCLGREHSVLRRLSTCLGLGAIDIWKTSVNKLYF